MSRLVAVVLTCSAVLLIAREPADAFAATRHVCVARATVYDTPNGLAIGYLHAEATVRVTRRAANRRWVRVIGPFQVRGWMKAAHLCR